MEIGLTLPSFVRGIDRATILGFEDRGWRAAVVDDRLDAFEAARAHNLLVV